MFNGVDGFHSPLAWFATTSINAQSLFTLQQHGFTVHMCLCNGAQANRTFIINHFGTEDAAVKANGIQEEFSHF